MKPQEEGEGRFIKIARPFLYLIMAAMIMLLSYLLFIKCTYPDPMPDKVELNCDSEVVFRFGTPNSTEKIALVIDQKTYCAWNIQNLPQGQSMERVVHEQMKQFFEGAEFFPGADKGLPGVIDVWDATYTAIEAFQCYMWQTFEVGIQFKEVRVKDERGAYTKVKEFEICPDIGSIN